MVDSYEHMQGEVPDTSSNSVSHDPPDAFNAAAHTIRNQVRPEGGRKEGAATYIPMAVVTAPAVAASVVKGTYNRLKGND